MAGRLFDSMDLRQALEIDDLDPVELGEAVWTAERVDSSIVYLATVPFTGSSELLLVRPETREDRAKLGATGLAGTVEDGVVHLQSRPKPQATTSTSDGDTWLDLQLNTLRPAVQAINRLIAERKQADAQRAAQAAADRAAAEEKARAINEELEARKDASDAEPDTD